MAVKRVLRAGLLGAALLCPAIPTAARADDAADQGRQIMTKCADAVVTLKMVLKTRMASEGREMNEDEDTNETKGTVIDASGLVVASLTDVDPSHVIAMRMQDNPDFTMEIEVTDLKIRLASGKEIPAQIVLRDKDLDLVYIRPTEKPEAPLAAVDLADSAEAGVLDEILVLSRMSEAANLVPSASLDRVLAVVEKPRRLYVPGLPTMMAGLGCPVFALDGHVIGIVVVRSIPQHAGGSDSPYGDSMPVIIPAADVTEGAKQASP